jgi:hypothetical protein
MNVSSSPSLTTPIEKNRFQWMARASWSAPLIGLFVHFILGGNTNFLAVTISLLFIGAGFLLGVGALFGINRYGSKGILIPSFIGICIPVALVVLALPSIYAARVRRYGAAPHEPAVHLASARLLKDERLHFSMDIPEGFTDWPESVQPNIDHCFVRDLPDAQDERLVVNVQHLSGFIPQNQRLLPEDAAANAPPGVKLNLIQKTWRGFKVDVFVSEMSQNGVQMIAYATQIPLMPYAIQINVGGPTSHRAELEKLSDQIIASVDGNTNWR